MAPSTVSGADSQKLRPLLRPAEKYVLPWYGCPHWLIMNELSSHSSP